MSSFDCPSGKDGFHEYNRKKDPDRSDVCKACGAIWDGANYIWVAPGKAKRSKSHTENF